MTKTADTGQRCLHFLLSPPQFSTEAYSYGKRALFIWQKSPVHMAKEAYSHVELVDIYVRRDVRNNT